jgi:hypothetical protein
MGRPGVHSRADTVRANATVTHIVPNACRKPKERADSGDRAVVEGVIPAISPHKRAFDFLRYFWPDRVSPAGFRGDYNTAFRRVSHYLCVQVDFFRPRRIGWGGRGNDVPFLSFLMARKRAPHPEGNFV